MNKKEMETLTKVAKLMSECPPPSPNPYDLTGYIHASKDYRKICYHAAMAIESFATFRYFLTLKSEDDIETLLEITKDKFQEHLSELEAFVNKRKEEGWE